MEPDVSYLTEFAAVEAAHRDFLRGALESLLSGLATKPASTISASKARAARKSWP